MKGFGYTCLLSLILVCGCQDLKEIEKPEKLLDKSQMKNLIYDMVLLDASISVNEKKIEDLSISTMDFLSKKYNLDSTAIRQNIQYYNLKFDDNLDIYQKVKDSIIRLEKSYQKIAKARDSIKKRKKRIRDSIRKLDTISTKLSIKKNKD